MDSLPATCMLLTDFLSMFPSNRMLNLNNHSNLPISAPSNMATTNSTASTNFGFPTLFPSPSSSPTTTSNHYLHLELNPTETNFVQPLMLKNYQNQNDNQLFNSPEPISFFNTTTTNNLDFPRHSANFNQQNGSFNFNFNFNQQRMNHGVFFNQAHNLNETKTAVSKTFYVSQNFLPKSTSIDDLSHPTYQPPFIPDLSSPPETDRFNSEDFSAPNTPYVNDFEDQSQQQQHHHQHPNSSSSSLSCQSSPSDNDSHGFVIRKMQANHHHHSVNRTQPKKAKTSKTDRKQWLKNGKRQQSSTLHLCQKTITCSPKCQQAAQISGGFRRG